MYKFSFAVYLSIIYAIGLADTLIIFIMQSRPIKSFGLYYMEKRR